MAFYYEEHICIKQQQHNSFVWSFYASLTCISFRFLFFWLYPHWRQLKETVKVLILFMTTNTSSCVCVKDVYVYGKIRQEKSIKNSFWLFSFVTIMKDVHMMVQLLRTMQDVILLKNWCTNCFCKSSTMRCKWRN